jgi:bacteriorhodopsin
MIEGLPSGRWAPSNSRAIAARLVQFLPSRNNLKTSSVAVANGINGMIRSLVVMWLIYAVVWGATLMMAGNREPPSGAKQTDTHLTNATSPPQVPLRGTD